MPNKHLKKFVEQARHSGMSDEQIKSDLTKAGWDTSKISASLDKEDMSIPIPHATHGSAQRFIVTIVVALIVGVVAGAAAWFWQGTVIEERDERIIEIQSKVSGLENDLDEAANQRQGLEMKLENADETMEELKNTISSLQLQLARSKPSVPSNTPPTRTQPSADNVLPVTASDHIRGDVDAALTLIEYSDFECPFCSRFHPTMMQILDEYGGQVRLVYRHFPLRSIHPNAQKAAEAAECAADQGKFWEMHDELFELNGSKSMSVDSYKQAAVDLGMNASDFNTCLDSGQKADHVEADYQDGLAGGVSGTPATFVGSQYVAGAVPYSQVQNVVEAEL